MWPLSFWFSLFQYDYTATVPYTYTKWHTHGLITRYNSDKHVCVFITVAIYKRAQILIGDIWACFRGQGLGQFNDIDTITMFADYR